MPKDKELTVAEAQELITKHEKQHGKDMSNKIPKGSKWGQHDVPTEAELDEEPEWHKNGQKLGDLPDEFPED